MSPRVNRMGKFQNLVDSPAGMEGFRAKYRIPQGVGGSRILLLGPNHNQERNGAGRHSYDRFHRKRNDDSHGEDN